MLPRIEFNKKLNKLSGELLKDGYMDFSYAIRLATDELKKIGNKEGTEIEKYEYLFVDEYQDITFQRFLFVKRLVEYFDAKLVAVGDDWQSIYGFNGSDVNLFINLFN